MTGREREFTIFGGQDTEAHVEDEPKPCTFCEIIEGNAPASVIHEDEDNIAIISLEGHPLVIPRTHFNIEDENASKYKDEFGRAAALAWELQPYVEKAYSAQGVNLFVASKEAAGQEIPHAHIHLIPRNKGDKKIIFRGPKRTLPITERDAIASKVKDEIGDTLSPSKE